MESWNFGEGKVTFVKEPPGSTEEQKEVRAGLPSPDQPRMSTEEQRKLTWTPEEENKKPKEEPKLRRERERWPFRVAAPREEEEEAA